MNFYKCLLVVLVSLVFSSLNSQITKPIGSNLTGIVDWSPEYVFTNTMSQGREWISHEYPSWSAWSSGVTVPLRPDGYPLEIPYNNGTNPPQAVRTLFYFGDLENKYPGGNYRLIVAGEGQVRLWGAASGTFTCPIDTVVFVDSSQGGIALEIDTSKVHNPIHGIKFVQPKYINSFQNKTFTDELIDFVSDFQTIRFMDWMQTNNSPVSTWNSRNSSEYCFQTTGNGVAYEHLINLCNLTNKDAWVCVPHQADDNFVTQFARLLRDSLNPNLKVYVEYSNEVWNSIFDQTGYADSMGNVLGYPGNPWAQGWQYFAKRNADIFHIFDNEFSDTNRYVKVISCQAANPWVANYILERFEEPTYNPNQVKADALAIAPYFGGVADRISGAGLATTTTVSAILDSMQASLPQSYTWMQEQKIVADTHNLELLAYEGGQHLVTYTHNTDTAFVNKLINANRHPRMQAMYCDYFDYWYDSVQGGLFCHFSSHYTPGRYGSWGAKETYEDTNSPKYLALKNCVFPANTSPLSLEEKIDNNLSFSVFPNPSSSIFYVDGLKGKSNYTVINTMGQLVQSGRLKSNQIDCSSLTPGIYFLRINNDKGNIGTERIVVSR